MSEIDAVIKIGGELVLNEKICTPLLKEFLKNIRSGRRLLVISGGGVLSDHVRSLYRQHLIKDEAAHWMAILSMDQSAQILAERELKVKLIRNPLEVKEFSKAGFLPVMLVYDYLRVNDELPHSWSVSSDSIAAYIASKIEASLLILVKNVDGLYSTPKIDKATLIRTINASSLNPVRHKVVDDYLREILLSKPVFKCWLINGYSPERVTELIETGKTFGTEIII